MTHQSYATNRNNYVPLHPVLAERLRAWQLRSPYPAPEDFLFPSETKKGKSPLYASTFVADYGSLLIVRFHEVDNDGHHILLELAAVEDAVMAHFRLHMVLLL
jgi:hypothetical protein